MTPPLFVDTNVLVYCFDDRDIAKRDTARHWVAHCWQRRSGRISTQVLNEFYNTACRKFAGAISTDAARAEVRRYQSWQPWAVDHATVETAWGVESRFGIGFWDALIVASAQALGCKMLLTEDLQHGQVIDSLRIVNPFEVGPEALDAAV